MKSTNRNTRRIVLAVCLSVSAGLLPQTAIPMPTETQGKAVASPAHAHGWETLSPEDSAYLFGGEAHGLAHPKMAHMTEEEMRTTEGKSGPAALGGFAAGALTSVASNMLTGQPISGSQAIAWGIAGATGAWMSSIPSTLGVFGQNFVAGVAGWGAGNTAGGVCSGSCHAAR